MNIERFKGPIPSRPPKDKTIEDSEGRKWMKVEPKECDENYFVEWDGDYWYVWFQGNALECPEEDEMIQFKNGVKGQVQTVRRAYNTMRAVVEIVLYKDC